MGFVAGPSSGFDEAAGELYAVPPQDFVAARDGHVARAREAGEADLAARLRTLRRPTQGAWLVNLLWRERRETVEQLLGLGDELRGAQQRLSGDRLRELSTQRHRVVGALVAEARRLASAAGVRITADTAREVEETFNAALASDDVAEQVRSGRLVKPVSYAGFGPEVALSGRTERAPRTAAAPTRSVPVPERAAAAVDAANQAVQEARGSLEEAERELASRGEAVEEAVRQREELRARLAELREQVRDLERRNAAAELDVRSQTRRQQQAEAARDGARRLLDRAEQRLGRLEG